MSDFKTAREYWIFTEVFVHLHKSDECRNEDGKCPHCKWIHEVFPSKDDNEHWIYCEVFKYLHGSGDHGPEDPDPCPHCEWMSSVFERDPKEITVAWYEV